MAGVRGLVENMLTRRRFAMCAIPGVAAALSVAAGAVLKGTPAQAATDLSYPEGAFVQLEVTDLGPRQSLYTAYRVSPRGLLTAARYTEDRRLLAMTPRAVVSPVPYRDVLAAARAGFRAPEPERGRSVRFQNWISAAQSTARRTRFRVLRDPAPRALQAAARTLEASVQLQRPQRKGIYVVTSPVEASGAQDLTIGPSSRQSAMAQAIVTSLSQEQLAVAVDKDRDVARFLEGENLNRLVFAAKFNRRVTHFSVVTAV